MVESETKGAGKPNSPAEPDFTSLDEPLRVREGTLVLWGCGVSVRVERRHLVVSDGVGVLRRTARYAKAPARLKRLVIIRETAGSVTLDAMEWLRDTGATLVVLGRDGRIHGTAGSRRLDDAKLRRAQAIAPVSGADLTITRYLLGLKVERQADVLRSLAHVDASFSEALCAMAERIRGAERIAVALEAEADAAAIYWATLGPSSLSFVTSDLPRIPAHWRTLAQRGSLLTGSPRRAVNPANATLNYLYALLEAQTTLALEAAGLDAGLGCFHVDVAGRPSFALDVMEAARPLVDTIALSLFASRRFAFRDAVEQRDGSCRLAPSLAVTLAKLTPRLFAFVAPVIEQVIRLLEGAPSATNSARITTPVPTVLTQARRRIARPNTLRRSNAEPLEAKRCRDCGTALEPDGTRSSRWRRVCAACSSRGRPAILTEFARAGQRTLAQRRAEGVDPAHGGAAARARGASNAAHQRAVAEFVDDGSLRAIDFARDVAPGLAALPLRAIADATGLSQAYCSKMRAGKCMPHRRHWQALVALIAPVCGRP